MTFAIPFSLNQCMDIIILYTVNDYTKFTGVYLMKPRTKVRPLLTQSLQSLEHDLKPPKVCMDLSCLNSMPQQVWFINDLVLKLVIKTGEWSETIEILCHTVYPSILHGYRMKIQGHVHGLTLRL